MKKIDPHLTTEAFDRIHTVKTMIEVLLGFGQDVHPAIKHYQMDQDVTNAARIIANLHTKLVTKIENEKSEMDFVDDVSREILLTEEAFESIVNEIENPSKANEALINLMKGS